jgi:hypothetical protein
MIEKFIKRIYFLKQHYPIDLLQVKERLSFDFLKSIYEIMVF